LLVDPFSVKSIKEGLQQLISNDSLRNELIAAGFENCKRFDPAVVAQKYLKIYRKLIPDNVLS